MQGTKKVPAPAIWLAAENGKQGPEQRLERYKTARSFNEIVLTNLEKSNSALKRYHEKINECGTWIVQRYFFQIHETRVIKANFCKKHLLCQLCALRRSALQVQTHKKKLQTVFNENADLVPVLVTLTVKDGEFLQERFDHIDGAVSRLVKKRRNAIDNQRQNTVLRYVEGGTGSYEFKRGSGSGQWHPHLHQIWLLKKGQFAFTRLQRKKKVVWVPLEFEKRLTDEWKAITGDSHMVDVRRIELENDKDTFGAMCEAFKYALKFNELKPEDQIHAAEVLQGRRLQRAFGVMHGVEINENLVDDLEKELALQPYVDLVYHFNESGYVLVDSTDYGPLGNNPHVTKKSKIKNGKSLYQRFTQSQIDDWLKRRMSIQKYTEKTVP